MAWISVHQSVDCAKLRTLRRSTKMSKAECLGLLTALWMWGLDNCAADGEIKDADLCDIQDVVSGWVSHSANVAAIVDAIVDATWIDIVDNKLYFHDWDVWQKQWYDALKERNRKAEYARNKRNEQNSADCSGNSSEYNSNDVARIPSPSPSPSPSHNRIPETETNKKRAPRTAFTKPTIEEIREFCIAQNNDIDAEYFYDYQEARGWLLKGGNKIKDWKAVIRTWEKNGYSKPKKESSSALDNILTRVSQGG